MKRFGVMVVAAAVMLVLTACGQSDDNGDDAALCEGVLCSGYGDCVVSGGQAVCRCNSGFHDEGLSCVADLCHASDCVHGHCDDPETSAACVCEVGYAGPRCDDCAGGYHFENLVCVADSAGDVCEGVECGNGDCVEQDGQPICDCNTGFSGEFCDACAENFHDEQGDCVADSPCNPDPCVHGDCAESQGAAVCDCDEGYAGQNCDACAQGYVPDGLLCVPGSTDDPCIPNPCAGEPYDTQNRTRCVDDGGQAACECAPGYHESENDADPCEVDTECDPDTTCSGHGQCTGTGLSCDCNVGYDGANCEHCADAYIWEDGACVPDPSNPCAGVACDEPNRGQCVVDGDSTRCDCDPGHEEVAGVCVAECAVDATLCGEANRSFDKLVSANGHGAIVVSLTDAKVEGFYEHPYKTWGVNEQNKRANTRNLMYDSYFGLKQGGSGTWLNTVGIDYAGYYNQDGVAYYVQHVGELRIETFVYAPFQLARPAIVTLARVTNVGTSQQSLGLYSLQNYHVGNTSDTADETGVQPDASGEAISRDGASGAFVEQGPGGTLVHLPLGAPDHFSAADAATDANPWKRLTAGSDLGDEASVAAGEDRVCGFQKNLNLLPGESGWLGVATLFERGQSATPVLAEASSAFGAKTPEEVLAYVRAEWDAWRKPMPAGLSADEQWIYRTSEAVLRMGQVLETSDNSHGQILASLPPGIWAISWVRDMSYSIAALIRSGHYDEAEWALRFMLDADSGYYTTEVGHDYQISITRFFGNGTEETDYNADGPNIEFDGFGLFLWVLGEYIDATGDTSILSDHWATIRDKIAGTLVALIDANGMIAPDSSIWEVHWNGQQKQFTYTSLCAQRGLCAAADMANSQSDGPNATAYADASDDIGQAIMSHALDNNFLVQSVEEYQGNSGYVDAAVVEAFNWMLFDPAGQVFDTTLGKFESDLRVAHGNGFFRNDDGGEYDSKEWVFIDLRIANAYRLAGDDAAADALVDWITAQAIANSGMIAELHTPTNAAYDGAIPMVGFGAGAYMLNLWLRENPVTVAPACGTSYSDGQDR